MVQLSWAWRQSQSDPAPQQIHNVPSELHKLSPAGNIYDHGRPKVCSPRCLEKNHQCSPWPYQCISAGRPEPIIGGCFCQDPLHVVLSFLPSPREPPMNRWDQTGCQLLWKKKGFLGRLSRRLLNVDLRESPAQTNKPVPWPQHLSGESQFVAKVEKSFHEPQTQNWHKSLQRKKVVKKKEKAQSVGPSPLLYAQIQI